MQCRNVRGNNGKMLFYEPKLFEIDMILNKNETFIEGKRFVTHKWLRDSLTRPPVDRKIILFYF